MKKQINPTIKAHLIRGAFYLLLLLAVCAIPFALAQSRSRGTAKRSMATPNAPANKDLSRATGPVTLPGPASGVVGNANGPTLPRTSQIPLASSGAIGGHIVQVPPPPGAAAGSAIRSVQQRFGLPPPFRDVHRLPDLQRRSRRRLCGARRSDLECAIHRCRWGVLQWSWTRRQF